MICNKYKKNIPTTVWSFYLSVIEHHFFSPMTSGNPSAGSVVRRGRRTHVINKHSLYNLANWSCREDAFNRKNSKYKELF